MGRKVCFNQSKHHSKIMDNLDEMRNDGDYCDFAIKVGGRSFPAHKNILSAGSEYFKAMFKHDTLETRRGEVIMKDMDTECFKSCLDFIYTAEFDIPDGKSCDLLHASQILQLNEVRDAAVEDLEKNLSLENFFPTRNIAKLLSLEKLLQICNKFEEQNLLAISNEHEFQNEAKVHVVDIFKSTVISLSQKDKFEILLRWVGGRVERKDDLLELLELIDMKEIPIDYVENMMENDSLIRNDITLYRTINNLVKKVRKSLQAVAQRKYLKDDKKANDRHVDGKTLVLFNSDSDCLQRFDPETNAVTEFHEAKFKHFGSFTAISLNSYIYVLCANKSVYRLNSKGKNSKWERLQDMLVCHHRFYPPVVSAVGSLFVIAGNNINNYGYLQVVECFDPVAGGWTRMKDKPKAVSAHALVSVDDLIYCIGGRISGGIENEGTNSFCRFNPVTQEWVDLEPMKNAKYGCGAFAINKKIFVCGGCRIDKTLFIKVSNELECFDIRTSEWSILSPMIRPTSWTVAHPIDGTAFAVKRFDKSYHFMKYDVRNDRWRKVNVKTTPPFQIYDFVSASN